MDNTRASLEALVLMPGRAEGPVLSSTIGLSFWGGVDPQSGLVIDAHHPLNGLSIHDKIVVIPSGRGSCSGSGIVLEMILNGKSPAAFVFERAEHILLLGVIIAHEFFNRSIPVLQLSSSDFQKLSQASWANIDGSRIDMVNDSGNRTVINTASDATAHFDMVDIFHKINLSEFDHSLLAGNHGRAAQIALRVTLRIATIQGATRLIDVTQAHIDGCVYTGPASLIFAEQLCEWNATVRIPSTMNSIAVDKRRWRAQGLDPALGEPASLLGDAYVKMGVQPTFTCAPYLLDDAPRLGDQIVWAESNAVVYANSILGAKTMKYADYLDICIALTGRAPDAGCHIVENRLAKIKVSFQPPSTIDDDLFPVLGYLVGELCGHQIPVIEGLEDCLITLDHLKAFGAAFATTSSAAMFHIVGVTPEVKDDKDKEKHLSSCETSVTILQADLLDTWRVLNSGSSTKVDLISLGNPHFSYSEFVKLATYCRGRRKHPDVAVIVTCGRATYDRICNSGTLIELEAFGIQVLTDTCWCMILEPIIPTNTKCIMTDSAKYAHYGVGITGRDMRFGSLAECIETACSGQAPHSVPLWLR